jgi:hypothetical protein
MLGMSLDAGKWTIHTKPDGVSFRQDLQSKLGTSYVSEKRLQLDKHEPVLILEH